jgi:hypothetical protein
MAIWSVNPRKLIGQGEDIGLVWMKKWLYEGSIA